MALTPPSTPRFSWRYSSLKLIGGSAVVAVLLIIGYQFAGEIRPAGAGTISVSDALVCLENDADTYFNVTLGTKTYLERLGEWDRSRERLTTAVVFVLSANTHSGTIKDLKIDGKVFLAVDDNVYPAAGQVLGVTKHHNTYLAFFPRFDMHGKDMFDRKSGTFDIIIEDVGKLEERVFTFHHPLPTGTGTSDLGFKQILMLLGAVLAALLISCTPCLFGSLTLGSLTMGTSIPEEHERALVEVRSQMMRRTMYFLVATVVGYLGIVIVINQFGVTVDDLRPVEIIGGLVLVGIGLMLARDLRPMAWALARLRRAFRRADEREDTAVGPGSSSAMGGSLALLCSVAGAPTLTTSIVLPVMVYAGMTSISWAFLIMLLFLVISAVPFFFVAMGIGELLYSVSTRWRARLMLANSLLLITLGGIMIFEGEMVADIISLPADAVLSTWRWVSR